MLLDYCGSHHGVLPLLLLHHRDLTYRGHAHHHRLDTGQIREKEGRERRVVVWEKKGAQRKKMLPVRHAEIRRDRQRKRETDVQTQAGAPAQSGYIYLLLDVAVGYRYGARRPVEEVLVGGHLARLHWTPCTTQLLQEE